MVNTEEPTRASIRRRSTSCSANTADCSTSPSAHSTHSSPSHRSPYPVSRAGRPPDRRLDVRLAEVGGGVLSRSQGVVETAGDHHAATPGAEPAPVVRLVVPGPGDPGPGQPAQRLPAQLAPAH